MKSTLFGIFILFSICFPDFLSAQSITLNRGFQKLKIGTSEEKVDEFIGFKGNQVTINEYKDYFRNDEDALALLEFLPEFDNCNVYKHIMPFPVTKIFYKNGKVSGVEINSYPSFTRPICLDLITGEGLKFWERSEDMIGIYGIPDDIIEPDGRNLYSIYSKKKIGFGLSNDEIRTIYYY